MTMGKAFRIVSFVSATFAVAGQSISANAQSDGGPSSGGMMGNGWGMGWGMGGFGGAGLLAVILVVGIVFLLARRRNS
jgi:hypothetical protein